MVRGLAALGLQVFNANYMGILHCGCLHKYVSILTKSSCSWRCDVSISQLLLDDRDPTQVLLESRDFCDELGVCHNLEYSCVSHCLSRWDVKSNWWRDGCQFNWHIDPVMRRSIAFDPLDWGGDDILPPVAPSSLPSPHGTALLLRGQQLEQGLPARAVFCTLPLLSTCC
jgi:hypothetical protein